MIHSWSFVNIHVREILQITLPSYIITVTKKNVRLLFFRHSNPIKRKPKAEKRKNFWLFRFLLVIMQGKII